MAVCGRKMNLSIKYNLVAWRLSAHRLSGSRARNRQISPVVIMQHSALSQMGANSILDPLSGTTSNLQIRAILADGISFASMSASTTPKIYPTVPNSMKARPFKPPCRGRYLCRRHRVIVFTRFLAGASPPLVGHTAAATGRIHSLSLLLRRGRPGPCRLLAQTSGR